MLNYCRGEEGNGSWWCILWLYATIPVHPYTELDGAPTDTSCPNSLISGFAVTSPSAQSSMHSFSPTHTLTHTLTYSPTHPDRDPSETAHQRCHSPDVPSCSPRLAAGPLRSPRLPLYHFLLPTNRPQFRPAIWRYCTPACTPVRVVRPCPV